MFKTLRNLFGRKRPVEPAFDLREMSRALKAPFEDFVDLVYRDEFEDLCERDARPRRILIAQARASACHNLPNDLIAAFQKLADDAVAEGRRNV